MRAINQVVTVREGEAVELACSADQDLKQCTFKNAKGEFRRGQAKGRFSYFIRSKFHIKSCAGHFTRDPATIPA